MSKHTPGPWAIRDDFFHEDDDENVYEIFPDRDTACGLSPSEICTVGESYSDSALANARLIAAAPELLEALKAAVDCKMVPITSAKDGGAAKHSIQVQVADQIRAAIAKATGVDNGN